MDRFDLIVRALSLMARFNVFSAIRPEDDERHVDMYFEALHMANDLGVSDAYALDADSALTLRVPFSDKYLAGAYRHALHTSLEYLDFDRRYPSNPTGHMLYCARGCNCFFTTDGDAECAACGAAMSPSFIDEFEDSLVAAGQLM